MVKIPLSIREGFSDKELGKQRLIVNNKMNK